MKTKLLTAMLLMMIFANLSAHFMDGWGGHHGYFMGGWVGLILGLLFLVIVVVIIAALFKMAISFKKSSPLDTLKKRYAKGEITREQFEEMKKVLKESE